MTEENRYKHVPDYGDWYVLDQKDGSQLYGSLIEDRLNAYESRVKELEAKVEELKTEVEMYKTDF